jgi:hypothetical protein
MKERDVKAREFLALVSKRCDKDPTDAYFLRKFFRSLLSAHWETPTNHGRFKDYLTCYDLRTPLNPQGSLVVKMSHEHDPSDPDPVPVISVEVGDTTIKKHVVANKTDYKFDTGETSRTWEAGCPITVTHTFHDGETALVAAQSTLEFLSGASHAIMMSLAGSLFEPIHLSSVKKTDKDPTAKFSVDVVFALNYDMSMLVNLEAHRIKVIETSISPE